MNRHQARGADLPAPGQAAAEHSERLRQLIYDDIGANGGRINFARFMELALYAQGLGYYVAGARKFGEAGDFVTAPEISPLFSRALARQVKAVLESLGQADVLEAGAGLGTMARDILLELEAQDCLPGNYFIIELSPDLRQRQRQTIEAGAPHLLDRVMWLDALPQSGFRGVVLGNEVLDAMPVHVVEMTASGLAERYVVATDTGFAWQTGELSDPALAQRYQRLQQEVGEDIFCKGYTTEINLAADAWVTSLADMLEAGLILLIDYGFPQAEYYFEERTGGTIMCHYRHRSHPDPLILVGLQDITAHVDFTAVAHAGANAGLDVAGYTAQAPFLLGNGLTELAQLTPEGDVRQHLDVTQQIKKLTMPSEMGELFKVIALGRELDIPLMGFMFQDRRNRL